MSEILPGREGETGVSVMAPVYSGSWIGGDRSVGKGYPEVLRWEVVEQYGGLNWQDSEQQQATPNTANATRSLVSLASPPEGSSPRCGRGYKFNGYECVPLAEGEPWPWEGTHEPGGPLVGGVTGATGDAQPIFDSAKGCWVNPRTQLCVAAPGTIGEAEAGACPPGYAWSDDMVSCQPLAAPAVVTLPEPPVITPPVATAFPSLDSILAQIRAMTGGSLTPTTAPSEGATTPLAVTTTGATGGMNVGVLLAGLAVIVGAIWYGTRKAATSE